MIQPTSAKFNAQSDNGAVKSNDNLPQWDLSNIYPSYDSPEFEADFQKLTGMIDDFAANYEGKIATKDKEGKATVHCNGKTLAKSLEDDEKIDHLAGRMFTYLGLLTVQDNKKHGANEANFENRITEHYSKLTFFSHEIKAIPEKKLAKMLEKTSKLERYEPVLEKIRKGIPHTKPMEVDKYAGELGASNDWVKSYDDRLVGLRFPFEGKELTEGEIIEIFTGDKNAQRRAAAHDVFQDVMNENAWYFADVHNALIRLKSVDDRWSKFENPWDSRHFSNGIEPKVVDALETAVKNSYSNTSQRFYALKAKIMGQDTLRVSDRNINPFDGQDEQKISWDEAKNVVLEAFASFSQETADIAKMFFDKGWIDAAPAANKRGGAFAHPGMAQTDNPFVMVNFKGSPRDVMTLAHELGHGVHQYLEAKNKSVMHAPLTLAETASVFGEMLTFKLLYNRAENDDQKRKMLFEKVNDMVNTTARQITFYDFEKRIHGQFKEKNAPLTKEDFKKHWNDALQPSYGDAIPLDKDYGGIFGYVPHLVHTPFYVYAYAFGDSLVNALYQVYEEGTMPEDEFKKKYMDMLAAGGTYKAEQLNDDFGLDISDPAFWNKGLDMIADMITELETLCQPIIDQNLDNDGQDNAPAVG